MIVNKTFISEILRMTLAVTLVIIVIFLVLRGMGFLSQAADGVIPVSGVAILVLFKMVSYLDMLVPLMFYIAAIMVINRWYAENEMAVLASAGLGLSHFLKPMFMLVVFLTALMAVFSFYLIPLANQKSYQLEQSLKNSSEVSGVITGKFVEGKDGNGVYFVEDYDRKNDFYENVFVYLSSFEREGVVVAEKAFRTEDITTEDQFLVLINGSRYEGNPGHSDYRVIHFEKYALRIEPRSNKKISFKPKARPNSDLINATRPELKSEWYWRIGKVFILPILALFALALSHVDSRQGKSSGMITAFLIYITYYYLLGYASSLIKKGDYATGMPIWVIHGVYFIFAVYCFYRRNNNLPLTPQFRSISTKRVKA